MLEEPYELIAHVRLCGEVDRVTGRLYPELPTKGHRFFELVWCSLEAFLRVAK